jgi:hypothetical protein
VRRDLHPLAGFVALAIDCFGLVATIATLPPSKSGERKRIGVSPSFARARRRR